MVAPHIHNEVLYIKSSGRMLDLSNNPIHVTLYTDMDINTILGIKVMAMMGRHYYETIGFHYEVAAQLTMCQMIRRISAMGFRDGYGCVHLTDDRDLTQGLKGCA